MRGKSLACPRSTVVRTFCNRAARERGVSQTRRGSSDSGKPNKLPANHIRTVVLKEGLPIRVDGQVVSMRSLKKLGISEIDVLQTDGMLSPDEIRHLLPCCRIGSVEIKGEDAFPLGPGVFPTLARYQI